MAFEAGKVMLQRIHESLKNGESFAFETTLSGRIWIKLIDEAKKAGYFVIIYYVILKSEKKAIERIRKRVREGGHGIPIPVVKRRFERSKQLFARTYAGMANQWYIIDNSGKTSVLIAKKETNGTEIVDPVLVKQIFPNL